MDISVLDGSNYFKGLLLLIRKDSKITESEHIIMMRIGKALGFEKTFTEEAINEIIDNKHISNDPPVFSSRALAEKFIKDGIVLAASDKEMHPNEEEWLLTIAGANKIEYPWYFCEKNYFLQKQSQTIHLDADDIDVCY